MRSLMFLVLTAVIVSGCVGRPPADATGEEIYLQLCSNCHGDSYEGGLGPGLGPDSPSANQPDEFLEVTIMQGRGRMPSFRSSLSDDQLEVLVAHLREVQGS